MQDLGCSPFFFLALNKSPDFRHVLRPSQPHSRTWALVLPLLLLIAIAWPHQGAAQQIQITQTPLAVQNGTAKLIGHHDPTQKLRLVFALRPPHLAEEEQFLNQLQDRNSPLFHKYLSAEEWNNRFAPSAQDERAVVDWAASQGLTITQRYPNRLLVDVEAPVAVIEKALNVTINRYEVGGKQHFSNDGDPSIPAALAGVVHAVLGLNNIEVEHTFSKASQNFTGPDYSPGPAYTVGSHLVRDARQTGNSVPGKLEDSYIYYQIIGVSDIYSETGYDYGALQRLGHCCNPLNNPNNSPPEASIAIAIWGDFADTDFDFFMLNQSGFGQGQLADNVQRYFVDGTPPCCSPETTLDVEWATAMANSFDSSADTAEVYVYEGVDNHLSTLLDVVNQALTDGHARVLSMSWGAAEIYGNPASFMDSLHGIFNQMLGQGWTLVAASGDGGATADCADHLSVSYPASDPDVTAVGGTQLNAGGGIYNSEFGWSGGPDGCANNDGGSGGGCSAYFAAPAYQSSPMCGPNSRSLPDIALNADWEDTPQVVIFDGTLQAGGGTSIAAPEMAAFYAQANAYLLYIQSIVGNTCGSSYSAPCAPLGNANWYLYVEGYGQFAPHYPFYDITSGCNGNDITQKYGLTPFCAAAGYDLVTGWGSANMLQLAWSINNFIAGDSGPPTITMSGPLVNHWYTTDQTISWTVTDTSANGHLPNGVAGFSYYWHDDPGDPYSEPTPAGRTGDPAPFYQGPIFPNNSNGSIDIFTGEGGCRIWTVRAWDNSGQGSASSYGPVCYDIWPPVTYATLTGNLQGQYYAGPVVVTLTATDPTSGVASTWYQVNGGAWQRYLRPIHIAPPGIYTVGFYSIDVAGNVENNEYANFIISSNSQNTLSVSMAGAGSGTVTATDGSINCGAICSYTYYTGTEVVLTATPSAGSVFAGWSSCDEMDSDNCIVVVGNDRSVIATFNPAVALRFVPVNPCRVVDTRYPDGPFGGPPITGGTERDFTIPQGGCAIPSNAAAYSLNATVVPSGPLGYLTIWPTGQTQPLISTLNSPDSRIKANAVIVPAGNGAAISVYASNTTNVILDINGYFVPANGSALAFFPLVPCRVADTRRPNGDLGGPYLAGKQERDFPVLESSCNIPSSAQAYSFNFTVVPRNGGPLGYLTVWPTGESQPLVSTLNDLTGTIVANAAIVPAGTNGKISTYSTNDTDLVIDANGYFAPANSSPNPLSLYTLLPCRVLDTRRMDGAFNGEMSANVAGSFCAVPSAQAYVLNATVVPQEPGGLGYLGYLTLWPDGSQQPLVSTLNAIDGAITSNMAIVPTTNGSIDAYANGLTQLLLDISSYFAP